MSEKNMTAKLAKQTVRESYPRACVRFGWRTVDDVREEYYEVYPTLEVFGRRVGAHYYGPTILGKSSTKAGAWINAAEKLIAKVSE